MRAQVAQPEDVESWLDLAAEVEHLFGPMVNEPSFMRSLMRNIERGSAFCIREADGPAGTPLQAGMLFSIRSPRYEIGWTAVCRACRQRGLGMVLLKQALSPVPAPADIIVTTFGPNVAGGEAARAFYAKAGFVPAEMTGNGPEGESRQVFRKTINRELPTR